MAPGESSIKTQVHGEAGTGKETSSQILAVVKMGVLSIALYPAPIRNTINMDDR